MEQRSPITIKPPAIRALQRINYYRLSAYGLSLKHNDQYHEGATFAQMHALYEFDQHHFENKNEDKNHIATTDR